MVLHIVEPTLPHIMLFFHDKISKLRIGWNRRPLTEDDFYRICRRLHVTVVHATVTKGGFQLHLKGRNFITIDVGLTGFKRTFVMFHELGHYLFHTPDHGVAVNFHNVGLKTRKEIEADAFALCALIPRCWIKTRSPEEICEQEGIDIEVLHERLAIYERHKI